jgi:large subunit ribosomal protein L35
LGGFAVIYLGGTLVPKMKTHKVLKKRVKVTATGKIKFHKHNKGHLLSNKSGNRKRRLRRTKTLTGPYADKMIILLGPGARN